MCSAPHRRRRRSSSTRRRHGSGVRCGEQWGRLERSNSPDEPSAKNRSRHLRTVLASTWNRSATASTVQPHSTTRSTIRRRPAGVSTAFGCCVLAWLTSPPCELCVVEDHKLARGLNSSVDHPSPSRQGQRPCSSQLTALPGWSPTDLALAVRQSLRCLDPSPTLTPTAHLHMSCPIGHESWH